MIKTTMREAKNKAAFTTLKAVKNFLNENNDKVKNVEKIAYAFGVYGRNGYLLRFETQKGYVFFAFTGRSTWMYNCDSLSVYND